MNWIEEYRKMLAQPNLLRGDIDAAQQLKIRNLPQKLYKYRGVNEYSLKNLEEGSVWMNKPSEYNDPFEFGESFDIVKVNKAIYLKHKESILNNFSEVWHLIGDDVVKKAEKEDDPLRHIILHLLKAENKTDEEIDAAISLMDKVNVKNVQVNSAHATKLMQEYMRVCSFCESPEQLLMWSHYAESHKGFCVEYDISQWNQEDVRRKILFPVLYGNSIYDRTDLLVRHILWDFHNPLYPFLTGSTKSLDWAYEREWRFILNLGKNLFSSQNYPMDCQSKVYLGYKISSEHKAKVIDICKKNNLLVYQSSVLSGTYGIKFDLIE